MFCDGLYVAPALTNFLNGNYENQRRFKITGDIFHLHIVFQLHSPIECVLKDTVTYINYCLIHIKNIMIYPPNSSSLLDYFKCRRQRRHRQRRARVEASLKQNKTGSRAPAKRRSSKRGPRFVNEEGKKIELTPEKTFWFLYYLNSPERGDNQFEAKFRDRFRLPYDTFLELYAMVKKEQLFIRWNRYNNGNNPNSLESFKCF